MNIYVATTTAPNFDFEFFGLMGTYSTLEKAKKAVEHYLREATDVIDFQEFDGHAYEFTTDNDETYTIEIVQDVLDYEFVMDIIEDKG